MSNQPKRVVQREMVFARQGVHMPAERSAALHPFSLPEGAPWRTQERGQLRQDEAPRRWVEVCFENHADQETFQETFEKRNAAYTGIRSDQM